MQTCNLVYVFVYVHTYGLRHIVVTRKLQPSYTHTHSDKAIINLAYKLLIKLKDPVANEDCVSNVKTSQSFQATKQQKKRTYLLDRRQDRAYPFPRH